MFHTITTFIKKETVLCIAALLAVISMFFVPPSPAYLAYIDFRVLALLFCLMLVVAGFQSIGFFRYLGNRLLSGAKDTRTLCLLLTGLCFFSSMFITNDVALITFVPFAVLLFSMAEQTSLLIPVIVLQTIAANLGSMLTPVGNPQNLYLYSAFSLSMGSFLLSMLPVSALSALLLLLAIFLLPNTALSFSDDSDAQREASSQETAFPPVGKLITLPGFLPSACSVSYVLSPGRQCCFLSSLPFSFPTKRVLPLGIIFYCLPSLPFSFLSETWNGFLLFPPALPMFWKVGSSCLEYCSVRESAMFPPPFYFPALQKTAFPSFTVSTSVDSEP